MVRCGLVELSLEHFTGLLSECPLNELTGLPTFAAHEAFGFDARLPVVSDGDFDGLAQVVPPT